MARRQTDAGRPPLRSPGKLILFYVAMAVLLLLSVLPHVGVFLVAFSKKWFMSVRPQAWTFEYFEKIFRHVGPILTKVIMAEF